MYDDAEVLARGCSHLYDLDIRRYANAIQNNTTCPPRQRTRVRYPQDDHDGKCKSCQGQSPPDSTWYIDVQVLLSFRNLYDPIDMVLEQEYETVLDFIDNGVEALARFSCQGMLDGEG